MRLSCLFAGVFLLAACDAGEDGGADVAIADSAGVQVVVNEAPSWAAEEGWQLGDTPRLEIGALEGDPEYQFDRLMGAVTLSDGRIAVADMGSSEVRLFDPRLFTTASG